VTDDDHAQLEAQLATDLAAAHRRVRTLDVPADEKALATRRLLAISDAAKHDVARAAKRLIAFVHDLDEGRMSASERSLGD
jgi:hypothetical protein